MKTLSIPGVRNDSTLRLIALVALGLLQLAAAPHAAGAIQFTPGFGVPGLWFRLHGHNVYSSDLQVEINGVSAVVQQTLGTNPLDPSVAFVQVPAGAKTGPLTVHQAGQTPTSIGNILITPVVTGHLQVPTGMNPRAFYIMDAYGASSVAADGSFKIPVADTGNTWIIASCSDPDVSFMALATNATDSPALNLMTTAAAWTLFHPDLLTHRPDVMKSEWLAAQSDPVVQTLAGKIADSFQNGTPGPLDSEDGYAAVTVAAESIVKTLESQPASPASAPPVHVLAETKALHMELDPITLDGLDIKAVPTGDPKTDPNPKAHLEFKSENTNFFSGPARFHGAHSAFARVEELKVLPGEVPKGTLSLRENIVKQPGTIRQEVGAVLVPGSVFSSKFDILKAAPKELIKYFWERNPSVTIPLDHPAVYVIRGYGGLGLGGDYAAERSLVNKTPGSVDAITETLMINLLDTAFDLISFLKDANYLKKLKNLKSTKGTSIVTKAGVTDPSTGQPANLFDKIQQDTFLWQLVEKSLPDLSKAVNKAIAAWNAGGSVDWWTLLYDAVYGVIQKAFALAYENPIKAAQEFQDFLSESGGSEAFLSGLGTDDLDALEKASKSAGDLLDKFGRALKLIKVLKVVGSAGSVVERLYSMLTTRPLQTALLYVGQPLAPQITSVNPTSAKAGDTITAGGNFIFPLCKDANDRYCYTPDEFQFNNGVHVPITQYQQVASDSTGPPQQFTFTLPSIPSAPRITRQGVLHLTGPSGEALSPPLALLLPPNPDTIYPQTVEAETSATISLSGTDLGEGPVVTVGDAQTPATISASSPNRVDFYLPSSIGPGEYSIYYKNKRFDTVKISTPIRVLSKPKPPNLPDHVGLTVNSRKDPGSGGERALSVEDAFELVAGTISKGDLPSRPDGDFSCPPYAQDLVNGTPGPNASYTIGFNENPRDCTNPDGSPLPTNSAPLELETLIPPANSSVDLTNPVSKAPPIVHQKLTLRNDNIFLKSVVVDGGTVEVSGKNITVDELTIKHPPALPPDGDFSVGALALVKGAERCKINKLTIEGAAGDAITFTESLNCTVTHVTLTGTAGHGVVFQDGAVSNNVGGLTLQGATDAGVLIKQGAQENDVGVVEISGVKGDGIRIEKSPGNFILGPGNIFGNTNAGIKMTGFSAQGNQVFNVTIGAKTEPGDDTTGNETGIEIDGASHNDLEPAFIGNSKLNGIAIYGGAVGNFILNVRIAKSSSNGILILDSYYNTVRQVEETGGTVGIHITGASENQVDSATIYGNDTGILIDGGSTDNSIYDATESWGNAKTGIEINGDGTSGNILNGVFVGEASGLRDLPAGATVTGNKGDGIWIHGGAFGNTIGWNPLFTLQGYPVGGIGNNGGNGVRITGSNSNQVNSTYIGANPTNPSAVASDGGDGVRIEAGSQFNGIGLKKPDIPFVVAGEPGAGVCLTGEGTSNNSILGGNIGFYIPGSQAVIRGNGTGIVANNGASDNTIGTYLDRHDPNNAVYFPLTVSGSIGAGILVDGPRNPIMNTRVGFIGNNQPAPNAVGIELKSNATGGEVRDTEIGGNTNEGIKVNGAAQNVIMGNWIGLSNFAAKLSNGIGVHMLNNAQGNILGNFNATAYDPTLYTFGNLISGNTQEGVLIEGSGTTQNVLRGNYIGAGGQHDLIPNGEGVHVKDAPENVIGSDDDAEFPDLDTVGEGGTEQNGAQNYNLIYGNTTTNVEIEGANATDNVIGNNLIGRIGATTPIGVSIHDGAEGTKTGGSFSLADGELRSFANGFYSNGAAIQVQGAGATGTTALYNNFIANGGPGFDRKDGDPGLTPVVLQAISQTQFQVVVPPSWPAGGLVQLYSLGATPIEGGPLQSSPSNDLEFVTEAAADGPGTLALNLPEGYFSTHQNSAQFEATITDPATGITSPFSAAVTVPSTPPVPAHVTVAAAPGLADGPVSAGEKNVIALALDFTSDQPARVTSLTLSTSGTGNDAFGVDQVQAGIATPDTLTLDSQWPLLADLPGFSRDNGKIALTGLDVAVKPGAKTRLLAVYTFGAELPAGTYRLSLTDLASVTVVTDGTSSGAIVSGDFPIQGPLLTAEDTGSLMPGDLNNDNKVNVTDVILLLGFTVGKIQLTPAQIAAADLNKSGRVDVSDGILMLKIIVGRQ